MAGIAKVFAGEVIEAALDYMEEIGDSGGVKPKHMREATRRLRESGKIPIPKTKRKCPFT
jgi:transcription initiation factor TFIID subunit 11